LPDGWYFVWPHLDISLVQINLTLFIVILNRRVDREQDLLQIGSLVCVGILWHLDRLVIVALDHRYSTVFGIAY